MHAGKGISGRYRSGKSGTHACSAHLSRHIEESPEQRDTLAQHKSNSDCRVEVATTTGPAIRQIQICNKNEKKTIVLRRDCMLELMH